MAEMPKIVAKRAAKVKTSMYKANVTSKSSDAKDHRLNPTQENAKPSQMSLMAEKLTLVDS